MLWVSLRNKTIYLNSAFCDLFYQHIPTCFCMCTVSNRQLKLVYTSSWNCFNWVSTSSSYTAYYHVCIWMFYFFRYLNG